MGDLKLPKPLEDAPLVSDWIAVEDGRLLVKSGRVELGQGNLTALLQMAADELDMDPASMAITGADTTRTPNEGFTAGSLSVQFGGMSLRFAASALRRLALDAAAGKLGCDSGALSVRDGKVLRDGAETGLDIGGLAGETDLRVPVADHAAPKAAGDRRVAGTALPRLDLKARICGAPFVHDMEMEGMLHGRAVHPPSMKGGLASLDLDALRARPGVVEVTRDGSWVGIVAEGPMEATAAANWARGRAEWTLPEVTEEDPLRALAASNATGEVVHETGDVRSVEGTAHEIEVSRPFISHGSIGPSAAVARWEGDRLTVWTHSQGVYQLRSAIAMLLGLEQSQVDVIHRPGAGCYGHNGADDVALDAALLARSVPGRPVKVVWSRADEFTLSPMGAPMQTRAKAVTDAEGRIASLTVGVKSAPHSTRPMSNGMPSLRAAEYLEHSMPAKPAKEMPQARGGGASRNAPPLYAIPNVEVECALVTDLPWRSSALRSLGAFANVYALELLIDRIAKEQGEDPVAFRLRHMEDPRARAVIEGVAEDAADLIGAAREEGAGWGMGFARYKNLGAYCAIVARVEVEEDLKVTDVRACVDMGEVVNPDGAVNQIEGGILQAMSWALKEAVPFDGAKVAAESWLDYPILTFSEVPDVRVRLIDRPEEPPLGAGEAAAGPMAAALGNALYDALGVQVTDLPLTRDAVMQAML